jgi:hypothetical protein
MYSYAVKPSWIFVLLSNPLGAGLEAECSTRRRAWMPSHSSWSLVAAAAFFRMFGGEVYGLNCTLCGNLRSDEYHELYLAYNKNMSLVPSTLSEYSVRERTRKSVFPTLSTSA